MLVDITPKKKAIIYPNVTSVDQPVEHGPSFPVPVSPEDIDDVLQSSFEFSQSQSTDDNFQCTPDNLKPRLFAQTELNDLVRDLGLTKEKAELLGSRLKEKHLLEPGTYICHYRRRDEQFTQFFRQDEDLVYCHDINGLMNEFGIEYKKEDWRFFIDSSKTSLKGVLLNNGNTYASVPVAHSIHMKEAYINLNIILKKINYTAHDWMLCGDLKVVSMLLGQQKGFTKFPCFICEWDSRARDQNWSKKQWPLRETLRPGTKNIIHETLVDPKKSLLPPLHIKLGLMKQFIKALRKDGNCFNFLCGKFSHLSEAKLKEGIFVGPDIRKLMFDSNFETTMNKKENDAWISFKKVVIK